MNWLQKLLHSHKWETSTNESPATSKTFPMYRTCTTCGRREILREAVTVKKTDSNGKTHEIIIHPKIWVEMAMPAPIDLDTGLYQSTTAQRYGMQP